MKIFKFLSVLAMLVGAVMAILSLLGFDGLFPPGIIILAIGAGGIVLYWLIRLAGGYMARRLG